MSVCIITGCGSGIGKATALQLAEKGFFDGFALVGRNREDIQATMDAMRRHTDNLRFFFADLAYPETIPDVVNEINRSMGEIGALLNIAGYTDPQPLLTTSLESFDLTYRIKVHMDLFCESIAG